MPLASHKAASVRPAATTTARRRHGLKVTTAAAQSPPSPFGSSLESPKSLAIAVSDGNSSLMLQLERKAQELCQETREQYELLLQRQETAHERQIQTAQATLQQVLSASISLVEHQQLMASEKETRNRERDELVARHSHELRRLTRSEADKWTHKLQRSQQHLLGKINALKSRCRQLELGKGRVEAAVAERERDLASLKALLRDAEHKQREAEARVEEACRHLASLRVHLRKSEARRRRAEESAKSASDSTCRLRKKLAGKEVVIAEMKGRLGTHAATIDMQLETERTALQNLQSEKKELAALALELHQRTAQLETREQLNEDVRAAERLQSEQQAAKLAAELADERGTSVKLRGRVEELQSTICQAQLALQEQRARLEVREQQHMDEKQRLARVVERHEQRAGRLKAENESLRVQVDELHRGVAEIEAFEKTIAGRGW